MTIYWIYDCCFQHMQVIFIIMKYNLFLFKKTYIQKGKIHIYNKTDFFFFLLLCCVSNKFWLSVKYCLNCIQIMVRHQYIIERRCFELQENAKAISLVTLVWIPKTKTKTYKCALHKPEILGSEKKTILCT
jgi:hypothetical protein